MEYKILKTNVFINKYATNMTTWKKRTCNFMQVNKSAVVRSDSQCIMPWSIQLKLHKLVWFKPALLYTIF